ncbi:MAG TPA: DNA recombination protein RmuC [Steroidobacteraceae bacterium]|jgi:DNA recombination protein RmuC|nr:DNA recombination protein RmuC [Steroidobacteraceae bacterium]
MSIGLLLISVVLALIVGAALGYFFAASRASRATQALQIQLEAERVRREAEAAHASERVALLEQTEARLRSAFDSLASDSLRANSEMFLRLAKESLSRDQVLAQSALKEREAAIAQIVEPLRAALERTEAQVRALENERRDAFSTLRVQLEGLAEGHAQLQRETRNLVTALRRPEVRGRWGEMTLRRIVEIAGMTEHCDFTEQLHLFGEEGALRPDLVVHMPEGRDLVVDVKTPLDAYLEAIEAGTDEARGIALRRHAQQVEARVRQLGAKNYWAQFEHSPEFAVLFLPGDQFLASALAERPELLENALKLGVIIATPSTLIALLKTVAYGWRQSAVAENAATIRELGQELYRRLGNFMGHISKIGQQLNKAVEAYNSAVGSLERQVLPQARRFPELGVTTDAPLATLEPVAQLARKTTDTAAGAPSIDAPAARAAAASGGATAAANDPPQSESAATTLAKPGAESSRH